MKKIFVIGVLSLIQLFGFSQKNLTLEEAVRQQFGKFYPDHLQDLQWLPQTTQYVYQRGDTLYKGAVDAAIQPWLTTAQLKSAGLENVKSLPSFHWTSATQAWFEDSEAYYNFDVSANKVSKVQDVTLGVLKSKSSPANINYHPTTGHLAFTLDNNVCVKTANNTVKVITQNPAGVISGQSISRNEYGIAGGLFWSDNGQHIAYYEKDERLVAEYPLTNYNTVPASVNMIRYPMAGGISEKVSLWVYHIGTKGKKAKVKMQITDINGEYNDQFYITNVAWVPDNQHVLVAWLNRKTDWMRLQMYDTQTGKLVKTLIEEKDNKWLEPDQAPVFVSGKPNEFIWRSYQTQSGFHNYQHINLEGKILGEWSTPYEQLSILGFNENATQIYIATTTADAMHTGAIIGDMKNYSVQNIITGKGLHDMHFSSNGAYILDQFNASGIPNQAVVRTSTGKLAQQLLVSEDKLKGFKIGQTELGVIQGHDGTLLNYRLIKPSQFDATKKYPVLVYVYNGPHVQLVNGGYLEGASLWMNYFAEKGYLVFTLDGRGSANRGKAFEQAIHRQLGTAEMEDQMAGVEWLRKQSYVDDARMAIHGWSFGGFMTTSLMMRQPGVFKCGVAGGPVLDWTLYEIMYTERYMDTPNENPAGYEKNNLNGYVKNLAGPLLMIHGTDDDVVVMQHNMRLLKTCITNHIPIDFFAYPGHAHNVRGKDRVHLMHKILDYVEHEVNH